MRFRSTEESHEQMGDAPNIHNFQNEEAETERGLVRKQKTTARTTKPTADVKIRLVCQPQILIPRTKSIGPESANAEGSSALLTSSQTAIGQHTQILTIMQKQREQNPH